MRPLRTLLLLSALALPATLVGCREDEAITKDTATYVDREKIAKRIAIVVREDLVWFFLISGPEAEVQKHKETFDKFVRSAKIDAKLDHKKQEPPVVWEEPKDWKKDHPTKSFLRYAGFRIKAEPKELEVTVTRMTATDYTLLPNVNRWRKQVNLPPLDREEDAAVKREKINDQDVTWVDVKGLGVHSVSAAPPAPVAKVKEMGIPFELPNFVPDLPEGAGDGGNPFKNTAPKEWKKLPPTGIKVEHYLIGEGKDPVNVTLIPLGGGGTIGDNIVRWRGEVKLPEIGAAEAAKAGIKIKVAGIDSYYADIDNPKGRAAFNRILAVMVPMGPQVWFIKMYGPREAVGANKASFDAYVKSFQLIGK